MSLGENYFHEGFLNYFSNPSFWIVFSHLCYVTFSEMKAETAPLRSELPKDMIQNMCQRNPSREYFPPKLKATTTEKALTTKTVGKWSSTLRFYLNENLLETFLFSFVVILSERHIISRFWHVLKVPMHIYLNQCN